MKSCFLILFFISMAAVAQNPTRDEAALYAKAKPYIRAMNENNKFELPEREEREQFDIHSNITAYSGGKARELLQELVTNFKSSGNLSKYHLDLGLVEFKLGLFDESRASCNSAIETSAPESDEIKHNAFKTLTKVAIAQNRFEEARMHLRNAWAHRKPQKCGFGELMGNTEIRRLSEEIAIGLEKSGPASE